MSIAARRFCVLASKAERRTPNSDVLSRNDREEATWLTHSTRTDIILHRTPSSQRGTPAKACNHNIKMHMCGIPLHPVSTSHFLEFQSTAPKANNSDHIQGPDPSFQRSQHLTGRQVAAASSSTRRPLPLLGRRGREGGRGGTGPGVSAHRHAARWAETRRAPPERAPGESSHPRRGGGGGGRWR